MKNDRIAIVTPSYAPDFELCRTLNRSVLEFLPSDLKHYIVVDRRDLELFRPLRGEGTVVISKEEIMPPGIVQLPGFNRWFLDGTLLPISGWLVQQVAKIATAGALDEPVMVMVDSDVVFVRDVDPALFVNEGKTRLFRGRNGITAAMKSHVTWHVNACRLLDVVAEAPPLDDYIGQVISWDRQLVLEMCARVEAVTGMSWYSALARTRQVSEYLLYGLFVEKVAGIAGNVWIDERARCSMHWDLAALGGVKVEQFARSLEDGDVALMISSHSRTPPQVRQAVIELATDGRLRS